MSLTTRKTFDAVVWMAILSMLVSGCITREEGCLDVNANNFDFDADQACSACCTYPSMMLILTQKWGDRNFTSADTLYDLAQQPYKIVDLRYFLTSWTWAESNGTSYTVDSVQTACLDQTPYNFTPDILLIDDQQFTYTLGTVRTSVDIQSLSFVLGSTVSYSCLDPENEQTPDIVTSQSPLWDQDAGEVNTLQLVIQRDLATSMYDTLLVPWSTDIPMTLDDINLMMVKGRNTQIQLTADYQEWLSEARIDDLTTFTQSILTYMAFTVTP